MVIEMEVEQSEMTPVIDGILVRTIYEDLDKAQKQQRRLDIGETFESVYFSKTMKDEAAERKGRLEENLKYISGKIRDLNIEALHKLLEPDAFRGEDPVMVSKLMEIVDKFMRGRNDFDENDKVIFGKSLELGLTLTEFNFLRRGWLLSQRKKFF